MGEAPPAAPTLTRGKLAAARGYGSLLARLAFAAIAIGIAAGVFHLLVRAFGPMPPFLTFYPAILLVTLVGGGVPGLFATLLASLTAVFWVFDLLSANASRPVPHFIALSVFIATNTLLCAVGARVRNARRFQAQASQQSALLGVIMSSVSEGVIATDVHGRITYLNQSAQTLLGCSSAEVRERPFEEIFRLSHVQDQAPVTGIIDKVLRGGAFVNEGCELELKVRGGGAVPVEVNASTIRASQGEILGVALTFRDCSERKSAEKEVKRLLDEVQSEKEWLAQLLSSINEEVYFTDTQRRYRFVNPAARREFAHFPDEPVEVEKFVAALQVFRADGTPRPLEESPPLRALAGEVIREEEQLVVMPRTGELRHRQVSAAPVRNAAGVIIGSVAVVRDVTDRKRVETELREADQRKNVFLATLSHELRNPLAPIRTAARLLKSAHVTPADLQHCRAVISRQVTQMASLLDDLLDVSRLTRGELTLKRESVPLQQVMNAAVEAAQPLMDAKHHRLQVELLDASVVLNVDPVRMTQVVSNLLTNAAKYTDPGGLISLSVRLDHEYLSIAVRDSGIGLAPELFAKVFQMFVQIDPSQERRDGGLGIGLALVKALVELHGGRVEVQSEGRGLGSTFTVRLPRSVIVELASAPAPTLDRAASAPLRSVLVADDNADGADILALLLQTFGHTVHIANDGHSALQIAAESKPDIAMLDIGMPGLSGYEVARRIRSEPWGRAMTLIAVTGWGQEEDKRAALAAGFDHHITKPMDPGQLEALLAAIA